MFLRSLSAATAGIMLLAGISNVSASVIPVATFSPDSVSVGESVQLDLQLNLFTDFGFVGPALFTGGSVTIFSGQSGVGPNTFAITPGLNFQDITANIVYTQTGEFTPSYTIHADYSEGAIKFGSCFRCGPSVVSVTKQFNFSGEFFDSSPKNLREFLFDHDVVVTAAVPEISTWMMLLLGFAAIGFLGWRREARALRTRWAR